MNTQQEQFLNLKRFPARLRAEDAALLLGFAEHEIPILVTHGLIKPLGHPPVTGVKYFAVAALEELRKDDKWLAKASDCIVQYWQKANRSRKRVRHDQSHDAPDGPNRFKRQCRFSGTHSGRLAGAATE